MVIKFNMDIDLNVWAEAIGYKIVGDKLIKAYRLSDFEEAVQSYIEAELESGRSSHTIEENFLQNDKYSFKTDFEYDSESIKEV